MSQNSSNSITLETLNDDMASRLLPVMIIVGIYMITGVFGNPLVAIYYGFYAKNTPSHHFILALSILDLIMCLVDMPLEIVDLHFYYNFESVPACKCLRFISYFCSITSGCILLAIAVDRFRKICQPFKKQITLQMTKVMIICAIFFGVFVSWPSLIFYSVVQVNVTKVPALTGFDCTLQKENYTALVTAYNIFQFICFVFAVSCLIVLYSLIGRKLYQLRSFKFYATKDTPRTEKGNHSSSFTSYSDSEQPTSTHLRRMSSHIIEIPDEIEDKPLATIKVLSSGSSYYDNKSRPTSGSSGYRSSSFSSRGSKVHPDTLKHSASSRSEIRIPRTKSDVTNGVVRVPRTNSDVTSGAIRGVSISSIQIPERLRFGSVKHAFSDRSIMSKFGSTTSGVSRLSGLTEYSDTYFVPETETRDAQPAGDIDDSGNKLKAQNLRTTKYTVIMLSITITFVLTYLPYLGLITWRTLEEDRLSEIMSKSELVALELFLRSFLISSIANPFIYGFLNTGFRNFVHNLFKKMCFFCPCCDKTSVKNTDKEFSGSSESKHRCR